MDEHSELIMEQFRQRKPIFDQMEGIVMDALHSRLDEQSTIVTSLEARVKTEDSLAGKLELKGLKYRSLSDITDILGARIITFYNDEVDRIAAIVREMFTIDWSNSIDKRELLGADRFGCMSLHYVCTIPRWLYGRELFLR